MEKCISDKVKRFYLQCKDSMLLKYGIMMKKHLPCVESLHGYVSVSRWYDNGAPKKFTGETFVDGSCVACRSSPELDRAGYAVVSIDFGGYNSDSDEAERPDQANARGCGCRNHDNPFHKCTQWCVDHGCDATCSQKRKPQPKRRQHTTQA